MSPLKRLLLVLIAVLALGAATLATVEAQSPASPGVRPTGLVIPEGFQEVGHTFGVNLYRKDYPGGTPDFVQVVDFALGAAIQPLYGSIQEARPGKGSYGGDDPRLVSRSLRQFWNEFASDHANPFCVVNGQFFYMPESPTRLPFPLKVNGQIVSDGYGKDQFKGKKLMLELWADHADIRELSKEALYSSSAPNIVAGLAEDAPKNIKKYVGRTFIGVVDKNGDERYETVLIFSTRTARQVDAASVLRSFGAYKLMMLDGGGSTQLICQDEAIIASERPIPQALGVRGGLPPQPWPNDVKIGEAVEEEGVEVAQAAPEEEAVPAQEEFPAPEPALVAADQSQSAETASEPVQDATLEAVSLATRLSSSEEATPTEPLYDLSGVLWVPAMMAPAMAFVFLIVLKMRFG
jgi:hypothetical protein